ncbi:hypothetical protein QBC36DRAFT_364462 [Triangularia setosa]|uniref:Uncharacterized protein n=1 Tax=Triangularia setosa TaxID=2587417 RepID=A0AAN7A8E8_9PEZI|nr:hypothetical protein QBC36DRAFT_364462 [Podospora setosa]
MYSTLWLPGNVSSPAEKQVNEKIRSLLAPEDQHGTTVNFIFALPWNPTACLPNRKSIENPLDLAYILTGYGYNVQAATAHEYMTQNWPDGGPSLFHFLAGALRISNPRAAIVHSSVPDDLSIHYGTLQAPNGSTVSLDLNESEHPTKRIAIGVEGADLDMVAEIASQRAWFCGAFRRSVNVGEIIYCRPKVKGFHWAPKDLLPASKKPSGSCDIVYQTVLFKSHHHQEPCWKVLFNAGNLPYPCVVRGYKIRTRPDYVDPNIPTARLEVIWELMTGFLDGVVQPPRPNPQVVLNTLIVLRNLHFILCSVVLKKRRVFWHLTPYDGQPKNFGNDPVHPPAPLRVDPDFDELDLGGNFRHIIGSGYEKYHPYVLDWS